MISSADERASFRLHDLLHRARLRQRQRAHRRAPGALEGDELRWLEAD
jgi:hypothetical protein